MALAPPAQKKEHHPKLVSEGHQGGAATGRALWDLREGRLILNSAFTAAVASAIDHHGRQQRENQWRDEFQQKAHSRRRHPILRPPRPRSPLDCNSEARRAYREARTAIALLQQRWPAAFPEGPRQVRPLITGLTPLIAAALGWSHPDPRAVLCTWKLRPAYCRSVLESFRPL